MENREMWLAETLVELADTRQADFDDAAYACGVAARLAELLRPAEIGLLADDGAGSLTAAAASTERMRDLVSLESRYAEGPGTACYRSGRQVLNQSVGTADPRWPRFASAARAAGFRIASALPMRRHSEIIGAVAVLDTSERPLAVPEVSLAQILAEAAAIGILHQRAFRRSVQQAQQLQRALDSRVLIEQAKGVVSARLGIAPGAAFELLRGHARRHNRQLAEVASAAVHGDLAAGDLVVSRQASHRTAARRQRPN